MLKYSFCLRNSEKYVCRRSLNFVELCAIHFRLHYWVIYVFFRSSFGTETVKVIFQSVSVVFVSPVAFSTKIIFATLMRHECSAVSDTGVAQSMEMRFEMLFSSTIRVILVRR